MKNRCRKCGELLTEQNMSPSKIRKHDYICRSCSSEYKKQLFHLNVDKTRETGRKRMRKWRDNPANRDNERKRKKIAYPRIRDRAIAYSREFYKNNPQIVLARSVINNGLKSGNVIKKPCEVCNDPKSEAHHTDYSKPLLVIWLCSMHHKRIHNWKD